MSLDIILNVSGLRTSIKICVHSGRGAAIDRTGLKRAGDCDRHQYDENSGVENNGAELFVGIHDVEAGFCGQPRNLEVTPVVVFGAMASRGVEPRYTLWLASN